VNILEGCLIQILLKQRGPSAKIGRKLWQSWHLWQFCNSGIPRVAGNTDFRNLNDVGQMSKN